VDNVLIKICDPVFVGWAEERDVDVACKVACHRIAASSHIRAVASPRRCIFAPLHRRAVASPRHCIAASFDCGRCIVAPFPAFVRLRAKARLHRPCHRLGVHLREGIDQLKLKYSSGCCFV
jgi:hypothetical protein